MALPQFKTDATAPPGAAIATGALPEGATRMVWPT